MQARSWFRSLVLLVTGTSLLLGSAPLPRPGLALAQTIPSSVNLSLWTTWGANQSTLTDDGASLWIGATGGVVRWDKQTNTYRRYTAVDGLPHTQVRAIAVDGAGNRWFGGDGGLSRLDSQEQWSHFTPANSGLHSANIAAIAVTADDTLYLSHGLPGDSVSRRQPDGSWRWFPNRASAIQADYALIRQTRNRTPLWRVVGSEIWSGYYVFDGDRWQDRTPPGITTAPLTMQSDSRQHLWVLANNFLLYEWDGNVWTKHYVYTSATALAIDAQATIWLGGEGVSQPPYAPLTAALSPLGGATTYLTVAGPVQDLLITAEGLWGIGPGWLMRPDQTLFVFNDEPRFALVADALVETTGRVWFYSGYFGGASIGTVQTFSDQGTATLADDQWQVVPVDYRPNVGNCELVAAFEYAPDGDIWYAQYCNWRGPGPVTLVRYHGPTRIEYSLSAFHLVRDLYAADAQQLWVAVSIYDGEWRQSLLRLDDRGTPLDTSDDQWQSYPAPTGEAQVAAVAAGERLWYGDPSGLYRYTGATWAPIYQAYGICDLTLATDGTLYAQVSDYITACQPAAAAVLVVRPNDEIRLYDSVRAVVQTEPTRVQTASQRNRLWTVADDGAIWYLASTDQGQVVERWQANQVQSYALPAFQTPIQQLAVDRQYHVWLVADNQLWRLSPALDFTITLPTIWLVAPGHSRQGPLVVKGSEGYTGTVSLTAVAPPAGLSVSFAPNPLPVDQVGRITVSAAPESLPATYVVSIQAGDQTLTHTMTLTVTVTTAVYDLYLPVGVQ